MLKRTHLALGFALAFYFMPNIKSNKFIFLGIVLFASILPDIETGFLSKGKGGLLNFWPFKWFKNKNWLFHTYTFLIPIIIFFSFFYPVWAFPFFLGYSFHLFLDSFSPQGITPFWPLKKKSTGMITPGGKIDFVLFYVFIILDIALFAKLFF